MSSYRVTEDPIGLKVIGQSGGANGHFFRVDLLDPKTKEHYLIIPTNDNHIAIVRTKNPISTQSALTKGYNIKGMVITDGFSPLNNGVYNHIELTDSNGKKFDVDSNYQFQMIEIHPEGSQNVFLEPPVNDIEYGDREPRKKKSTKTKPKRKVVKKCRCK
jgi:hypothetical protein